ncbi:serine/threonine protein kinase, partial [Hyalangium sp.]|uniref:serine/threonine protein kinase n=1 Tax=Hyalangium sp. TaxID=2028555 RepID=UPI002D6E7442
MDFGCGNYLGAGVLTRQPQPPGTPQYQSPESQRFEFAHLREPTAARYESQAADDVYALGMTAYRLVTGRYPPPSLEVEKTRRGLRLVALPWVPPERWVVLCPELALLIRQMLSEEPSARGSAGDVARALERAAETAGPEADGPTTPRPAEAPPAPARAAPGLVPGAAMLRTRPWLRSVRARAPWLAATVGVCLVMGTWWTARRVLEEMRGREAQGAWRGDKADAGTSGLGDAGIALPVSVETPQPAPSGIQVDMPKNPLPGQRLSPCEKPLVEINGGCWVGPRDKKPPCGLHSYEWRNQCYWPMITPQRPTTSEPP